MAVDLVVRCLRGTEWIVASEVDGALRPERIDLARGRSLSPCPT
ncbi:hypothetical protein ACFSVJ_09875 [Prauserella oleivorans]